MEYCISLGILISVGTKLLVEQCPTKPTYMEDMDSISYASEIGSLMYAIVYISQEVGVFSPIIVNPRCEHCVLVKRVSRYM
jgi:hypothetical protein